LEVKKRARAINEKKSSTCAQGKPWTVRGKKEYLNKRKRLSECRGNKARLAKGGGVLGGCFGGGFMGIKGGNPTFWRNPLGE